MIPALLLNYFIFITSAVSVSCVITLFAPQVGSLIADFTTYGSRNEQRHKNITKYFAVPKRWFRHFYFVGVICTIGWIVIGLKFTWKEMKSADFVPYLRSLTNKTPQIPFSTGMIVLGLILIHVIRRFIETVFISIYSDTSMNVFHYIVGINHYIALPLSIVCETLGFASKSVYPLRISIEGWSQLQYFGFFLFAYSSFQQFKIALQLANARKGSDGSITSTSHTICYGGWFDLVSCPHFLFEMLIYAAIAAILPPGATAFKYVLGWTVVNQLFAALITHRWYKSHFKDYPPQRKAVLPYLI